MKKRLVYGVGVNDADYVVEVRKTTGYVEGKQKRKLVWGCHYYQTWKNMLNRCYSEKWYIKNPTYIGCYVCDEWKRFSNFKRWMEQQNWEGNQLDKDLLFPNNKFYSPDTCVFVSKRVNTFLTERGTSRGQYPIGVHCMKKKKNRVNEYNKPYIAKVNDGTGTQKHLGCFATPEEAHQAWLTAKLEQAKILAAEQTDPRVAKALIERYENYKESS